MSPKSKSTNSKPTKPLRARVNITMPEWLHDEASLYGAKRGYGMSELIARVLEKFVEEEKKRNSTSEATSQDK